MNTVRASSLAAAVLLASGCNLIFGIESEYRGPGPASGGAPTADAGGDSGGTGALADGAVDGGTARDGGSGREAGSSPDGGADANIGRAGQPCAPEGAYGCAGRAQRGQLVCTSGVWASNGSCASGSLCDATTPGDIGFCNPVVPECDGRSGGALVCLGRDVARCGPDLVTTARVDTCVDRACVNGACAGSCVPDSLRCNGLQPQTCGADGNWGDTGALCDRTCDAATGQCAGECKPRETRCDPSGANGMQTCAENATWGPSVACDAQTAFCAAGACTACPAGTANCDEDATRCETNLNSPGTCGTACDALAVCAAPTSACRAGRCVTPSCDGLRANCGASSNEGCCLSPPVTGGDFFRTYDGVTAGYTSQSFAATVSDLRLDRFEATVGRFRRFVTEWNAGFRPAAGAGKHRHLRGGAGLADSSGARATEGGWDTAWAAKVAPTDTNLACDATYATWTAVAGANETRPVVCLNWYEAYAFCVWDDGFLPSEAESNYAASGGADQRVYPWSSPPGATPLDCTYANYGGASFPDTACAVGGTLTVGKLGARGIGSYGQADLSGNATEWVLDAYSSPLGAACVDCAYLPGTAQYRVARGGSFKVTAAGLLAARRYFFAPDLRDAGLGVRCARTP